MSLQSNVTSRYSDEKLRRLTNPDSRAQTSNDSTRLGLACTDAEAEFERRTAVAYDDTNAQHVDVCVELVVLKLMERGTASAAATEAHRARVERQFESLAKITGRDRPNPTTSAASIDIEREGSGGQTAYNKFDRRNLAGFVPRSPSGS